MSAWPMVALGEVCKVVSGGTPKTTESSYWDGDIPWATPKDLSSLKGNYIDKPARFITAEGLKSSSAVMLPPNSVLLSSRAPIGLLAINTTAMATNQGFKSLIPDRARIEPHYLVEALKFRLPDLLNQGNGATFKEVSKAAVERFQIPFPPLSAQRRIAQKLEASRRALRAAEVQVEELRNIIEEIAYSNSGQSAEMHALNDILTRPLRNGVSPSAKGKYAGTVLTLSAITGGHFREFARKNGFFDVPPLSKARVEDGSLLICRGNGNRRLVGIGALARPEFRDLIFPDTMIEARFDASRVRPELVPHLWNSGVVQRQIQGRAKTTNGTYKVSQADLRDIRFPVPSLETQGKLAAIVRQIERVEADMQARLSLSGTLFDALQYRAFRGEL
ncbi:restriction endonuclease subunit S [Kocuria sp. LUK]|uniref:restriction endonuclease subunit S n=1 Tax=Kocuria sp. LUK TaxID=2897828 RepID=UPI001E353A7E|nr:restriction endonuclease subunit S [Kocuria sp. LUK]MCD1144432.1 restriction endonuclease subunit S [Kocuria sp. LUK]